MDKTWGCYQCGNLKKEYCTFLQEEIKKDSYCPEYRYPFEKKKEEKKEKMNNTIKKLEKSIEFYNMLIQQSIEYNDPQIYISFLEGQVIAYENILKEIYKIELKNKRI